MSSLAVSIPPAIAAIAADGLCKTFEAGAEGTAAISNVTFAVRRGEFVCVVGPSGCGKSTLLNLISGLLHPSAGRLLIDGRSAHGLNSDIGYVFQRDALLPWKTALENVMLPLILRGTVPSEARMRAQEWVDKVGLRGYERHYPAQLSGGMRKRVALAMTMVYRPPIILMDEPFAQLDVQMRNLMENELLALWAGEGSTVLFVTHDLEEAIALGDRIVVMTASPGSVKAVYPVILPRPRDVTEIRMSGAFVEIYRRIWADLREEVLRSHARG